MATQSFSERCNAARPKFARYCSEPFPEDVFVRQRWTMSGAHLLILESLQNIYNIADDIQPEDQQSFARYCNFAIQFIVHHHHLEETIFFPGLAPEFTTDVLDEHAKFSEILKQLDEYLKSVMGVKQGRKYGEVVPTGDGEKERAPFHAATIKRLLDELANPLFTHLEHEIGWLDPDKLRESGIPAARMEDLDKRAEDCILRELNPSVLVFTMGNTPPYCRFPKIPWFMTSLVVPLVLKRRNKAEWRFLPKSFPSP